MVGEFNTVLWFRLTPVGDWPIVKVPPRFYSASESFSQCAALLLSALLFGSPRLAVVAGRVVGSMRPSAFANSPRPTLVPCKSVTKADRFNFAPTSRSTAPTQSFFVPAGPAMRLLETKPIEAPLTRRGGVPACRSSLKFRFPPNQMPGLHEFRLATPQAVSSVAHVAGDANIR
jgi:hypothetical protein